MKTFKDITFTSPEKGDINGKLFFDNGYGISVIRNIYEGRHLSYTKDDNQWEIAVLYGNKDSWSITYNTPITDDVIGYLSSEEVEEIIFKIQKL